MTENDATPSEPARPEIDAALLREAAEGIPAADESPAGARGTEDPELPGLPLSARIEALLFVAAEPVPLRRLKELLRTDDGPAVREALARLAQEHAAEGRATRVEEVAGGFQLRTRPEFAPLVARAGRRVEAEKLSAAALETLAIVAYLGPVSRPEIARIRGVAADSVVAGLVERGLIAESGREEGVGGAVRYRATPLFERVFGLDSLSALPRLDDLGESTDEIRERLESVAERRPA
jgi:segregation and condensation protein B